MRAIIRPGAPKGIIEAPPSKSMAHRLLICAGLSEGISRVDSVAMSEDIKATTDCLKALGADITKTGTALMVKGVRPENFKKAELDCKESGSTLRFMVPVAAMSDNTTNFYGKGRLMSRPLSVYQDIFEAQGLRFDISADGLIICGRLSDGEYKIRSDISSQFISGLMLALPLADGDSIIRLTGSIESRPYVDMTMAAMELFGVHASWESDFEIKICGRQSYKSADLSVEGDWSNAAYLMALGVDVSGLDDESLQGDKICSKLFKSLDEDCAEIDIKDCPDLGPALMAYGAMRKGCILTNTERLKIKESDRGCAMKKELMKFGVIVREEENKIVVGNGLRAPDDSLFGHNDHRIVMALSAICCTTGGVIEGAEAVNKSFPDYFDRIAKAGADIDLEF